MYTNSAALPGHCRDLELYVCLLVMFADNGPAPPGAAGSLAGSGRRPHKPPSHMLILRAPGCYTASNTASNATSRGLSNGARGRGRARRPRRAAAQGRPRARALAAAAAPCACGTGCPSGCARAQRAQPRSGPPSRARPCLLALVASSHALAGQDHPRPRALVVMVGTPAPTSRSTARCGPAPVAVQSQTLARSAAGGSRASRPRAPADDLGFVGALHRRLQVLLLPLLVLRLLGLARALERDLLRRLHRHAVADLHAAPPRARPRAAPGRARGCRWAGGVRWARGAGVAPEGCRWSWGRAGAKQPVLLLWTLNNFLWSSSGQLGSACACDGRLGGAGRGARCRRAGCPAEAGRSGGARTCSFAASPNRFHFLRSAVTWARPPRKTASRRRALAVPTARSGDTSCGRRPRPASQAKRLHGFGATAVPA